MSVNVVAGHSPKEQQFYGDFLAHDERYARTEEFLRVCNALWHDEAPVSFEGKYYRIVEAALSAKFESPDRRAPVLFIAGGSDQARDLTISQGTCWMRMADRPEAVADASVAVRAAGKQVGLRLCVICRPTREHALQAARDLIGGLEPSRAERGQEAQFVSESDSVSIRTTFDLAAEQWLTPTLWTGAVRTHGAPTMSLVGTPREIADAVLEYGRNGVSHFIFSGWPKLAEMTIFGEEVIPLVRAAVKSLSVKAF